METLIPEVMEGREPPRPQVRHYGFGCLKGCASLSLFAFNLFALALALGVTGMAHSLLPAVTKMFEGSSLPLLVSCFFATVDYLWLAPALMLLFTLLLLARGGTASLWLLALGSS